MLIKFKFMRSRLIPPSTATKVLEKDFHKDLTAPIRQMALQY